MVQVDTIQLTSTAGTILDAFELLLQSGDYALQPLDIIPAIPPFVDDGSIVDIPCGIGIFEGVHSFTYIPLSRDYAGDH